jgi:hypothetical protein
VPDVWNEQRNIIRQLRPVFGRSGQSVRIVRKAALSEASQNDGGQALLITRLEGQPFSIVSLVLKKRNYNAQPFGTYDRLSIEHSGVGAASSKDVLPKDEGQACRSVP